MFLSPLRGLPIVAALALLSCADGPGPPDEAATPTPPPAPPPVENLPTVQSRTGLDDDAIAEFRAKTATSRDFVINFGEPFIGFETRESEVLVLDFTAGERFAYVAEVQRTRRGGELDLLITMQSAWSTEENFPWQMSIKETDCVNDFTGELTSHTAWVEIPGRNIINHVRTRGCARVVGTPQQFPWGRP